MPYECKFGFAPGYNLVFSAFQPSGTGRGLAYQFLQEVINHGYYRATPGTDLVVGDTVLVYEQEKVYWESALVYVLNDDYVFYDGEYVMHEGEYVRNYDAEVNERVFLNERTVGTGEYESVTDISATITNIYNSQTDVHNVYDERDRDGAGAGAGAGIESEIITDC